MQDSLYSSVRCKTVTVWAAATGHSLVRVCIAEKVECLGHNPVAGCANYFRRARCHSFRPLRCLTKHENRLAKRRRFFLHPPGVGEYQVGSCHGLNECTIRQGLDERYILELREYGKHDSANIWVHVHRIHKSRL